MAFLMAVWSLPTGWAQTVHTTGSISGSFNVTLSGSASYSIPVTEAPGAAGLAPQISIAYDSQSPSGFMGAGWSLAGISQITRGPKTLYSDGEISGVNLTDNDAIYLDGQRLVPISIVGSGSSQVTEYRKETDDITRIRKYGANFDSSSFVVNTKAGLTLVFNGDSGSNAAFTDGVNLSKSVSYIFDTSGNAIHFEYINDGPGSIRVSRIEYTQRGNISNDGVVAISRPGFAFIDFSYSPSTVPFTGYVAGHLISEDLRLSDITSTVIDSGSTLQVAKYHFVYDELPDSANRFVLKELEEFGSDNSQLTPTTFTYTNPPIGWANAHFQLPIEVIDAAKENIIGAYRVANTSQPASANRTLLFSAEIDGSLQSFAFLSDGLGGWKKDDDLAPEVPFVNSDGSDLGVVLEDVTGGGQDAILQSYSLQGQSPVRHAYLVEQGKWVEHDEYNLPFDISQNGKIVGTYLIGNLSGGHLPDLLYQSGTNVGFRLNSGAGAGWQKESGNAELHSPPVDLTHFAKLIDIDCDGSGRQSLVTIVKGADGAYNWRIFRFTSEGWSEETRPQFINPLFSASVSPAAIRMITLPGSACPAMLVASAEQAATHEILMPSPTGWKHMPGLDPPFDLVDKNSDDLGGMELTTPGQPDTEFLIHHLGNDGSNTQFAFRLDSTGWHDLGPTFSLPILKSDNNSVRNPLVLDPMSDGPSALLFPSLTTFSEGRVFLESSRGFLEQPDYAPPIPFADTTDTDRGIRFVDLNGDGLPDIIVSRRVAKPGSVEVLQAAYLNTGRGWVSAPGLIPPPGFEFAGDGITGNPVQFVDVDGDGFVDMLYSYKTKDGKIIRADFKNEPCGDADDLNVCGTSKDPRFRRKWVKQPISDNNFTPPAAFPFAIEDIGDQGIQFADLNGDGRPDMIGGVVLAHKDGISQPPLRNCPALDVGPPPPGTGSNCTWNRSIFQTFAYMNNGQSWVRSDSYAPPVPFVSLEGAGGKAYPLFTQLVDVTGDGLPDLVASFQHPYDPSGKTDLQEIWHNTGSGWSLDNSIHLPTLPDGSPLLLDAPLRDPRVSIQWLDIAEQGRPAIIYAKRTGSTNQSMTWLSTGEGFVDGGSAWKVPVDAIADQDGDPGFRFVDVNGDGYPDLLYSRTSKDGNSQTGLYINTGSGWIAEADPSLSDIPAFVNATGQDQGVRLLDVTGRGSPDIVTAFSTSEGGIPLTSVLLNLGRRSALLDTIDTGYGLKTVISYQSLMESDPLDSFSGNDDQNTPDPNSQSVPWRKVYDLGMGPQYPLIAGTPAIYLVRRVETITGRSAPIAFSYRYGSFRINVAALRPVGFGWMESLNETNGILTHTELSQDIDYPSKILYEGTCSYAVDQLVSLPIVPNTNDASDDPPALCEPASTTLFDRRILSTTSTVYSTRSQIVGSNESGNIPRHRITQISTQQVLVANYELDGNVTSNETTTFVYDEPQDLLQRREEVLETSTARGDGTSVTTDNTYLQDNPSLWMFDRLTHSIIHKIGDFYGSTSQRYTEVRTAAFGYDQNTGLLSYEVQDADSEDPIKTTYRRDIFGNIVTTIISAPNQLDSISSMDFDSLGRFPEVQTNPLGQKTTTYRSALDGQPVLEVDPNQLETQLKYDGFGRPTVTVLPNGLQTTSHLIDAADILDRAALAGLAAAYGQVTQIGSLPAVLQLYDNQGHLIRAVSEGYSSDPSIARPIQTDFQYDSLGRLVASSQPYDRGSVPSFTTQKYDVLNREIQITAPNGATIKMSFSGSSGVTGGSTVVTTDPLGHTTTRVSNTRGLPILVTDAEGGTQQYKYDAGDRLVEMIGPMGERTEHQYNDLGEEVESIDPDLGTVQYEYDTLRRLVRTVDRKNRVATIDYDALGRKIRVTTSDVVYNWQYDTSPHGIGKLASVEGTNGYLQSYEYDRFGRIIGTETTVGEDTFSENVRLDQYGRVTTEYYPNGFAIDNVYDSKGFLVAVKDNDDDIIYWSLRGMNAAGQATSEAFGNGTSTIRKFDPNTGEPIEFSTSLPNKELLDLNLDYDADGNLLQRQEKVQDINEAFKYDPLDRLISMQTAHGIKDKYTYDAAGRIIVKSDLGKYSYPDSSQDMSGTPLNQAAFVASNGQTFVPFDAVSSIQIGARNYAFTYDANGNLTSGPIGSIQYNSENQATTLFRDQAHWTQFSYGVEGSRFKEFARDGSSATETISLNSFEKVTDYTWGSLGPRLGSTVRYRYYISNGQGVFAVVERETQYFDAVNSSTEFPGTPPEWLSQPTTLQYRGTLYLQTDQQGSILLITDGNGVVNLRLWYDPWGKIVRKIDASGNAQADPGWTRGYLSNEYLPTFDLIHMNGRIYNPTVALFTSADPINASILDTQASNGFSYARDNPLRFEDPSGFDFLGIGHAAEGFVHAVGGAIVDVAGGVVNFIGEAGQWVSQNWRTVVIVAAVIAVSCVSFGAATPFEAILSGMAMGATGGALSAALYGGSFDDVLEGAIKGGVIGAVSGAALGEIGDLSTGANPELTSSEAIAGHGIVGGAMDSVEGGNFWRGFASGALTKTSSLYFPDLGDLNVGRAALVGGTVAVIGGGKFANGAITGAESYALNDDKHIDEGNSDQSINDSQAEADPNSLDDAFSNKFQVNIGSSVGIGPKMYDVFGDPKPGFSLSCCGVGPGVGSDSVYGGDSFSPNYGISAPGQLASIGIGGSISNNVLGVSSSARVLSVEISYSSSVNLPLLLQKIEMNIYRAYGVPYYGH